MTDMALTVLDTTGIQEYIFGSNRLRENVVASYLVECATGTWVAETLPQPHNLTADLHVRDEAPLEAQTDRQAEVIYRGGGNVVILFRSHNPHQDALTLARETVGKLSRILLERAPGLHLAAAHAPFTWSQDAIGGENGVYVRVMQHLAQTKQRRRSSLGLTGQSVTLTCRSTGLPAVDHDPEEPTRPVSAAVAAKVDPDRRDEADARLKDLLSKAKINDETIEKYAFSRDFDDLGRAKGEISYIAVVHADANNMGQRFEAVLGKYVQARDNRRCVNALRNLSNSLNTAGATALQTTVRRMMDAFKEEHFQTFCTGLPTRRTRDGQRKPVLPFRPLVFGGDDVTFVCDGRLGLTLAATYLEQFRQAAQKLSDGKQAYACAGIAIVKTHYPFARAYALCDDLCSSAKRFVRDIFPSGDGVALDWYFATTGITADLDDLRERYYQVPGIPSQNDQPEMGYLDMRPVVLDGPGWRTWHNFDQTVQTLLYAEAWRERRNKVIALREALRDGGAETERFRVMYGVDNLPRLDYVADHTYRRTGWIGDRCAYFDAIEALDCYLPLTVRPLVPEEVSP